MITVLLCIAIPAIVVITGIGVPVDFQCTIELTNRSSVVYASDKE